MGRLALQDAQFLAFENEAVLGHVAGALIFEPPPGEEEDFVSRLSAELREALPVQPPFNYQLHQSAIPSLPSWDELDDVDLDYHLRVAALPKPGTMAQLTALLERLHSRPLDHGRPLWEFYLIEGLEGGRFAMYLKVHHALVDGVTAMSMLDRSLSRNPKDGKATPIWQVGRAHPKKRKRKTPAPSPGLFGGLIDSAAAIGEAGSAVVRTVAEEVLGIQDDTNALRRGPKCSLNVDITVDRKIAFQSLSLQDVRALAKGFGVTINDAVLAICSGAVRRYLKRRGELPRESLRVMCPVSVVPDGGSSAGNNVSGIMVPIATHIADPIERLEAIVKETSHAKDQIKRMSAEAAKDFALMLAVLYLADQLVPHLEKPAQLANLVISNVPGPREPRYLAGARLVADYPISIVTHGQALNITVQSCADSLDFGLLAAKSVLPDLNKLTGDLVASFEELDEALEARLEETADRLSRRIADIETRRRAR